MPTAEKKRTKKPRVVWFDPDRRDADAWFNEQLEAGIRPEVSRVSLVEWAESRRVIPQGLSVMPGLFSWSVTPYLEEIAENLSETSPVQEVAVMKGAQIGFTVGILENWMLYTIDQAPGPMLYVAQSQQAAEQNMSERITPAIVQSGLEHKVFAQSKTRGSRKTGNTDDSKQFAGGRLRAIGPNMGARIRSDSYKLGAFDEMDSWAKQIGSSLGKRKSEGSTVEILKKRFVTFSTTYKICYGSTPGEKGESQIEGLYELGDQRQYHVPCKHCGELQPLEWERLKYETEEDGSLKFERNDKGERMKGTGHVWYECRACNGHWINADKIEFLKNDRNGGRALWVPSAESRRPNFRSYHISSLYSPIGFWSWEEMAQEACEAGKDPLKLQTFWNTSLGRTWRVKGGAPEYTRVMLRREDYRLNEWPFGAEFVTIGADTQKDRIEAEVVAWGRNKESWSLGYHVFHGDTSDLSSGAWTGLADLITREHAGKQAVLTLVDAGYETSTVYTFCENMVGAAGIVMPSMGESAQARGKRLYAIREVTGFGVKRVDIQTNQLKEELYQNLNRVRPEEGLVPTGYCHFPLEYGEKYFKMLTAEEPFARKMPNGGTKVEWRVIPGRGRNEALDCRVYAMAALNVLRGMILQDLELDDEQVTWEQFWEIYTAA